MTYLLNDVFPRTIYENRDILHEFIYEYNVQAKLQALFKRL